MTVGGLLIAFNYLIILLFSVSRISSFIFISVIPKHMPNIFQETKFFL